VVGASWEGFVIEQIAGALPPGTELFHYRTSGGAEVDVVLTFPDKSLWAIEIKRSTTARPSRGFHEARTDLQPTRAIVVHPGEDRYPGGDGTEVLGVVTLIQDLMALHP
jgi:hypothetical protein